MSSIWTAGTMQTGSSPFAATGLAPSAGGGAAAKFQSLLQAAGGASGAGAASTAKTASAATGTAISSSATAAASADSDSSGSTGTAATITANDFLSLLVTEMQNQDPTAQTDPNEYINQLVQINSLEQLISINQNLADVLGTATTSTSSAVPATSSSTQAGLSSSTAHGTAVHGAVVSNSQAMEAKSAAVKATSGNLNVPHVSAASRTVAHSLDGHPRTGRLGHGIRDIPTH